MNRKITPYLIAAMLLLGWLAYLSERPRRAGAVRSRAVSASVLGIPKEDILRLRMQKDFWNSYVLARNPDGQWMMEEPARGAANTTEVRRLLETVTLLPVLQVLDMPGDDAERHREYGLWTPALEITLSTPSGATTLMFGSRTPDESGVYAVVHGTSRVYVVPAASFGILERGADTYRETP